MIKTILDNGIKFYNFNHNNDVSRVSFYYENGSSLELPSESGITHLIEHLCFNCTSMSELRLKQEFDSIGARIEGHTDSKGTIFTCDILNQYVIQAVQLLIRMTNEFYLNQDILDKERKIVLIEIDECERIVQDTYRYTNHIFHKYGIDRSALGSSKTLNNLTVSKIIEYKNKNFRTDNLSVIVTSKDDSNVNYILDMLSRILPYYFNYPNSNKPNASRSISNSYIDDSSPDDTIQLSLDSIDVDNPDLACVYYIFDTYKDYELGSFISDTLGTGFNNYLYRKTRVENSIAYLYGAPKLISKNRCIICSRISVHTNKNDILIAAKSLLDIKDYFLNITEYEYNALKNRYVGITLRRSLQNIGSQEEELISKIFNPIDRKKYPSIKYVSYDDYKRRIYDFLANTSIERLGIVLPSSLSNTRPIMNAIKNEIKSRCRDFRENPT